MTTATAVEYGVQQRPVRVPGHLAKDPQRRRTVSDVVVETLVACGVDTVFGAGGSDSGFGEALARAQERGDLRFVRTRHEAAASFAASAYGKVSGRPAACVALAGPGSSNLVAGLYDATLHAAPVVAITARASSKALGENAFQQVDLSEVLRDVSLSAATLSADADHAELVGNAVAHAVHSRGVAHLVLPDEVQALASDVPAGSLDGGPAGRRRVRRPRSALRRPRRVAVPPSFAPGDWDDSLGTSAVLAALARHCPDDAVVAVDLGDPARSRVVGAPDTVLVSGPVGSGYPAALGAWVADPTRPVVAITDDNGFGQYLAELTTAVRYGIPVKQILLDSASPARYGGESPVARWNRPSQATPVNPDFAQYANLCGAIGIPVHYAGQLDVAMVELFAVRGPALLHVHLAERLR